MNQASMSSISYKKYGNTIHKITIKGYFDITMKLQINKRRRQARDKPGPPA